MWFRVHAGEATTPKAGKIRETVNPEAAGIVYNARTLTRNGPGENLWNSSGSSATGGEIGFDRVARSEGRVSWLISRPR